MNKKIYCFDLDGTITKEEILPLLAGEVGLFDEMTILTDATLRGQISFEQSLLLRVRLLDRIPIERIHELVQSIRVHEEIVSFIRKHADNCCLVTGNLDVWIKPLIEKIGCRVFSSHGKLKNGQLDHVTSVLNKKQTIIKLRDTYETIIAVGDSTGDIPMFEAADVGIAFGGTHPPAEKLLQIAHFEIDHATDLCHLLSKL